MVSPTGKGHAFERNICRRLSFWLTGGKRDDIFWRTPGSGGRATRRFNRTGQRSRTHAGDIYAHHRFGEALTSVFMIECKCIKGADMAGFVYSSRGLLSRHWDKAREQARDFDRLPMLLMRENHRPEVAIVTDEGSGFLEQYRRNQKRHGIAVLARLPRKRTVIYNLANLFLLINGEALLADHSSQLRSYLPER